MLDVNCRQLACREQHNSNQILCFLATAQTGYPFLETNRPHLSIVLCLNLPLYAKT